VKELADAVIDSRAARPDKGEDKDQQQAPRKRSARAAFRAEEPGRAEASETASDAASVESAPIEAAPAEPVTAGPTA
jgi:hypothetical protein